jgi:hypothetical protein
VGSHASPLNACGLHRAAERLLQAVLPYWLADAVGERQVAVALRPHLEPVAEQSGEVVAQRDDTRPAALAVAHGQRPHLDVDVSESQRQ